MELANSGAHRLPGVILEHRSLTKLHSFFAALKLQHAEAGPAPGGGSLRRIRGSFNQTTTETGETPGARAQRAMPCESYCSTLSISNFCVQHL